MASRPNFAKIVCLYGAENIADAISQTNVEDTPGPSKEFMITLIKNAPNVYKNCTAIKSGEVVIIYSKDRALVTTITEWCPNIEKMQAMDKYCAGALFDMPNIPCHPELAIDELRGAQIDYDGVHYPSIYTGWWSANSPSELADRLANAPVDGLYRTDNNKVPMMCSLDNMVIAVDVEDADALRLALKELAAR